MFAPALLLPFLLVPGILAQDDGDDVPTHGEGEEGSSMGPVAFMWPPNRDWSAAADNVAPCGSRQGPGNRTGFPLSQGSVALSIADEAWKVVFRVAYEDSKLIFLFHPLPPVAMSMDCQDMNCCLHITDRPDHAVRLLRPNRQHHLPARSRTCVLQDR